jgi:hypothetical protein
MQRDSFAEEFGSTKVQHQRMDREWIIHQPRELRYWFQHWKSHEKPEQLQLDSTRSALWKLMKQLNRKVWL